MSKDINSNNTAPFNLAQKDLGVELVSAVYTRAPIEDIRNLIDTGADVNTRDDSGRTSLNWACIFNNSEIADLLVKNGADVNIADNDGSTPIHCACRDNNLQLVTILIDRGADVNVIDIYCNTPLDWPCRQNNLELARLIVDKGAQVDLSLLKAFVRKDERGQIDEIINNLSHEPTLFHLKEGGNIAILDLIYFPEQFNGIVHLIGDDATKIALHFCGETGYSESSYILK